jgi:hypothetical protein
MLAAQNMLREQTGNLKTFNIIEESSEFVSELAKSHTVVRRFENYEVGLITPCLKMIVETMQGPCHGNQDFVAEDRKIISVSKNVLSASLEHVTDIFLKWNLYRTAMAVSCGVWGVGAKCCTPRVRAGGSAQAYGRPRWVQGGACAAERMCGRARVRSSACAAELVCGRAHVRPSSCAAERMCDLAGRRGGEGGLPPTIRAKKPASAAK